VIVNHRRKSGGRHTDKGKRKGEKKRRRKEDGKKDKKKGGHIGKKNSKGGPIKGPGMGKKGPLGTWNRTRKKEKRLRKEMVGRGMGHPPIETREGETQN